MLQMVESSQCASETQLQRTEIDRDGQTDRECACVCVSPIPKEKELLTLFPWCCWGSILGTKG